MLAECSAQNGTHEVSRVKARAWASLGFEAEVYTPDFVLCMEREPWRRTQGVSTETTHFGLHHTHHVKIN